MCARCAAGELAELLLPVMQGLDITTVDLHRAKQRLCAALAQPLLDTCGKTAKVRVLTVTQSQYGVFESIQAQGLAEDFAFKTPRAVGRFTIAKGADHEQGMIGLLQIIFTERTQWLDPYWQARGLQLPGCLPGQLLGKAALAGKADQP